jgi:O-methyltransferase
MNVNYRFADKLLAGHPVISDQVDKAELRVILAYAQECVEKIPGDIVEFGCYIGTTSLFLTRVLRQSGKKLYVYDSFEGLPEKTSHDQSPVGQQFKMGELSVAKSDFIMQFKKAGLPVPIITKGWFKDVAAHRIPSSVSFAYLDGDYYESIQDSLRLIEPRLAEGAVVIVDDYANEALPGAAIAVDEWLTGRPHVRIRIEASLAILKM